MIKDTNKNVRINKLPGFALALPSRIQPEEAMAVHAQTANTLPANCPFGRDMFWGGQCSSAMAV